MTDEQEEVTSEPKTEVVEVVEEIAEEVGEFKPQPIQTDDIQT